MSDSKLYRYRGTISALFGLLLIFSPGEFQWHPLGLLLIIAALGIRVWTRQYIGEHTRGTQLEGSVLYIWGPYSRMRHPLYLANLLFGWGLILLSGGVWYWQLPLAILWLFFNKTLGDREDLYLLSIHTIEWWIWAFETPFWGWGEKQGRHKSEHLYREKKRSISAAFWADRWSWFWQLLLLLLLASPMRGACW